MTYNDARKRLIAKVKCMIRDTSGTDIDCNNSNCDECDLCYEQGCIGDQKEALKVAINALDTMIALRHIIDKEDK